MIDNMSGGLFGEGGQVDEVEVDAETMRILGPGYDYYSLTTVYPRLEGEEGYTLMPSYKRLGVGAYANGRKVPETKIPRK